MSENLLNTIYLAGAFLVLFASAEFFYHKLKLRAELTRKYVHIFTGLLTMLFPPFIENHWFVLLLCGSFFFILLASLGLGLLPSINAVERKTRGSILYPIIVYGCFLLFKEYNQFMFYYIPILILALCDPVAALVGVRWPMGKYQTFGITKTMSGSFGFFILAIIICLGLMLSLEEISLLTIITLSIVISLVTTLAESFTHKGYDNLSIPLGAILILIIYNQFII